MNQPDARLKRDLGVVGATMMGLGAMVGTGVFVSIGIAAGIAGPAVILAIALAALVAACNALNSAQLAASLPVSGGTYTTPYVAVIVAACATAALALAGSVKTTWSFSAFTVLIYYAITNLAALRLPDNQRLYSRWFAWTGLAACLFLAFWVEWPVWSAGLGLLVVGLVWHWTAQRSRRTQGGAAGGAAKSI